MERTGEGRCSRLRCLWKVADGRDGYDHHSAHGVTDFFRPLPHSRLVGGQHGMGGPVVSSQKVRPLDDSSGSAGGMDHGVPTCAESRVERVLTCRVGSPSSRRNLLFWRQRQYYLLVACGMTRDAWRGSWRRRWRRRLRRRGGSGWWRASGRGSWGRYYSWRSTSKGKRGGLSRRAALGIEGGIRLS
jgi:hypothetical protein